MDDIVNKTRYSRYSGSNRRRRRNTRESSTFAQTLMCQLAICIILLVIVGIIKSANTPVTEFLADKVRYVFSWDINLKEVYGKADAFLGKFIEGEKLKNIDKSSNNIGDEPAVQVSAQYPEYDKQGLQDQKGSVSDGGESGKTTVDLAEKYKLFLPVDGAVITGFGQVQTTRKEQEFHKGVDIEATEGAAIKAALRGEIEEIGNSAEYGKYIKVKHDDELTTLYGYCSELIAKKGQIVEQGEIIAKVGSTEAPVGTHLHFEIWKDGEPINPLKLLKVHA